MRRSLAKVRNRQGRVDVLFYQLAERWMERLEVERGLAGLREQLLPLVEAVIVSRVPAGNVIPLELRSLMTLCEENFRRRRC